MRNAYGDTTSWNDTIIIISTVRRLAAIAVYRAPAQTLTPGCLVTRVAVAEGYTSAQQVHDAFYAGQGWAN